jgi:hypothetical protein
MSAASYPVPAICGSALNVKSLESKIDLMEESVQHGCSAQRHHPPKPAGQHSDTGSSFDNLRCYAPKTKDSLLGK